MDGEINNLITVWWYIFMSSCYCYGTTKLVPKGTTRFFMYLPILCLFLQLPLQFTTVNFSNLSSFFITWLASFKLLLLAFDTGPLSNPSFSLIQFFLIFSLPINLQRVSGPKCHPTNKKKAHKNNWSQENGPKVGHPRPNSNTHKMGLRSPSHYAKKFIFLVCLIHLGDYKDKFPHGILLFLMFVYIYVGLEVILGMIAIMGQALLKTKIDPPFDDPYLSTSLHDFWGRRWNRVASTSLRSTIFYPTFNYTSPKLGRKWAAFWALVVTFIVSDVMHEVIFYYMGRVRFAWGTPLFFLLHGLLVAVESSLKRKLDVKWRLPQVISGPLIFGFVIWTFMRLVLPELLAHNVDDRLVKEYAALYTFVMDLGRASIKKCYSLIVYSLWDK